MSILSDLSWVVNLRKAAANALNKNVDLEAAAKVVAPKPISKPVAPKQNANVVKKTSGSGGCKTCGNK